MALPSVMRVGNQIRIGLKKLLSPQTLAVSFKVVTSRQNPFVESVDLDPGGLIRLVGWWAPGFERANVPALSLDGNAIPYLQHFRLARPSLTKRQSNIWPLTGLAIEYVVPMQLMRPSQVLEIDFGGDRKARFHGPFHFAVPDYREMLDSARVFHREDMYGSGPPKLDVHPEVLALVKGLRGPILDFGCGRGALISQLAELGTEAHGLELDDPKITEAIPLERRQLISLYNGSMPSPFADGQFRSVVCSEVLEHIPDYLAAIADIARLATEAVLLTVPDASAIPMGFRHGVVPWHMLEATHVNFFTQRSLERALQPYFASIEFGRIVAVRLNDSLFHTSLAALCWK